MNTETKIPIVLSSTSKEQIGTLTLDIEIQEALIQVYLQKQDVQMHSIIANGKLQAVFFLAFNKPRNPTVRAELEKIKQHIDYLLETA
jgi:hypothetical protein